MSVCAVQDKRVFRYLLLVVLSSVIFCTAFFFRKSVLEDHVRHDRFSPWSLFSTEAAMHYYFTEQIYKYGWDVFDKLASDQRIVYPSVSDDWQTSTIAMEFLPALLMRSGAFYTLSEAIFFSTCLYYALKFVLLCIMLFFLSRSAGLSLSLTLIALTAFHSYARSVVGFYLREDFGILLILLSLVFFIRAHQKPREWLLLVAAVTVVLALNSWHFAPFLYLPAAFITLWMYLGKPGLFPEKSFLTFAVILMVGCLLFPMSRYNRFCFSPFIAAFMLFAFGWRIESVRSFALRRRFFSLVILFSLALLIGSVVIVQHSGHVFGTIWEKLQQGGIKPEDPGQVSFLTRLYWDGDYVTPTAGEWYADFRFFILFSLLVPGIFYYTRRRWQRPPAALLWIVILGAALSFTARRNLMISVLLGAVAAGIFLKGYWQLLPARWRSVLVLLTVAQLAALPWGEPTVTMARAPNSPMAKLVAWLNEHRDLKPAVAGHFPDLPSLLAFTDASIITHSKFENQLVRERAEDFYKAMYGPPENLAHYLRDLHVNLLLVNLDYLAPRRLYQGGVKSAAGTAIAHLAEMVYRGKSHAHLQMVLNLLPQAEYALLYFYPQGVLSQK